MIHYASPEQVDIFLRENRERYPNLDPDFILQICFEHPDRFNDLLPAFDPEKHSAVRVEKSVGWVYDNVRYDDNAALDFWYEHFDALRESGNADYEVFTHMMRTGAWPFPPVIVEAGFAVRLGTPEDVGKPFHLIEGTHRVSYARRMIELGLTDRTRAVEIIELTPTSRLGLRSDPRLRGFDTRLDYS